MKYFKLVSLLACSLLVGCYDDSTLKEDISDLQKRVSNLGLMDISGDEIRVIN
jgi:hypothetical protein